MVVLTMLINGMVTHGFSADDQLLVILVNIPKDLRGNFADSDNYRGMALCSSIGEIIDYVILTKYESDLCLYIETGPRDSLLSELCFSVYI